jgi:preprotein translocase subunit YajC
MFESPAFAATGGAATGGAAGGATAFLIQIFPFAIVLVIFYMLMIRPQQRQMKAHREMVANVKPRDMAVTNGGLIGKVTKVDEREVELEVAQGVRVKVLKSMLSDITPHGTKPAND